VSRVFVSADAASRALGADALAEALSALGATVTRTGSRGLFAIEPLVEVEEDGARIGYGPVAAEEAAQVLAGSHPNRLGQLKDLPFFSRQTRRIFARCGVIERLDPHAYEAVGGWRGLERARAMAPPDIIAAIASSGLRGLGGAGFPAGIKWAATAEAPGAERFVVCNADEGDSGTFADRMLMEGDPFSILEGMAIAGAAVGAMTGYLYIRSEYPAAVAVMEKAAAAAAPRLTPFTIEVRVGAGAYVCGEETSLLESIEGRRGEVRAKPPLPAHAGLFGQPTLVSNVLTLAAAVGILAEGPEAFAALGHGKSRGTLPIQLAGNISNGGLFEAPFGVTLDELINTIGGGTDSGRPVRAVQVGGPLGAYFPATKLDLPIDFEAFTEAGGLIGHGGVVVFDDTVDMGEMARFAMAFCAAESCGKCTPCRIGSVRGVETIDALRGGGRARDAVEALAQMRNAGASHRSRAQEAELLRDLCETMRQGSLCALGGFTPFPVLSALKYFPEDFGLAAVTAEL
jgi:formate dehydrogenase iron-sulfur subunit